MSKGQLKNSTSPVISTRYRPSDGPLVVYINMEIVALLHRQPFTLHHRTLDLQLLLRSIKHNRHIRLLFHNTHNRSDQRAEMAEKSGHSKSPPKVWRVGEYETKDGKTRRALISGPSGDRFIETETDKEIRTSKKKTGGGLFTAGIKLPWSPLEIKTIEVKGGGEKKKKQKDGSSSSSSAASSSATGSSAA